MIQGKLIEYGQDLSEISKVWNSIYPDEMNGIDLKWGDEIAIYGVIHNNDANPVAAGKLVISDGRYEISNIAVIEKERNKGYGDFLVKLLINKAFISGAECVYTSVTHNCIEFFEKIGFKIINEKNSIQELLNMILFTSSVCRKCSKI